ncbi:MAG: helix-turn-helix domain-containing protein [Acidobacteriota bacterium]|nr:helix-turn-helix domain-containing protein [Acidobacteriota bacterium]
MDSAEIPIQPALNTLAILNLMGAVQGLLLALALLSAKGGNRLANRLLGALTLSISAVVAGAVLLTTNYVFLFPHLSRIHHPLVFLVAPLLFLYIRTLTSNERRFEARSWLHFIPSALCLIYLLPYYFQSSDDKLRYLLSEFFQESLGRWYYFRSALLIAQSLAYLVLIISTLARYSRKVKDRNSPHERAILFQVRFFVIASLILWAGALLRYTLDQSGKTNLLVPLGASVLIYALGYLQMRERFRPAATAEEAVVAPAKKYESSTLTPERSERYLNKLLEHMEREKPFKDRELTIQKLAKQISIPPHHLSQTINERLGKSFSDFINSYRVAEAKRRLLDPSKRHYSVLAIAEDVGFNSKSSFNTVFKKHVNMTPSEFRKSSNGNGDH